MREIQEIADQRDDDHADNGAQDVALAAIEAGAADHDGGNHLEFQAARRICLNRADAGEQQVSGEGGGEPDDDHADNLHPVGADAREHRDGTVRPDRIDPFAEGRLSH